MPEQRTGAAPRSVRGQRSRIAGSPVAAHVASQRGWTESQNSSLQDSLRHLVHADSRHNVQLIDWQGPTVRQKPQLSA